MTDSPAPGATFRAQVLERWSLTDPELVLLDLAASTLDLITELEGSDIALHLSA
jgi:hypothetical protein